MVRRGRSWLEKWRMPGERSSARSVLKKLRNELSLQRRKVQFEAPEGSSLAYTRGKSEQVERALRDLPGVGYTYATIGAGATWGHPASNMSS